MATCVWLNKYFGEEFAKDERLSKLKYVYNTEGIIKNLRAVVKTNCVDLIIIDSYADLFTGSMNTSNEVRFYLNMYNSIANEFGVTVVILHHAKKASASMVPNKNSILGSQGFEAKMRSVLMLTQDNSDESLRHLCIVKNNYLPESEKSMSYVLRFNDHLAFDNIGERAKLKDLALED
jgi:RecA-family ATPase